MAPFSQEIEPPRNPGRFNIWSQLERIADLRKAVVDTALESAAQMNNCEPCQVIAAFKTQREEKIAELSKMFNVDEETIIKTYQKFPALAFKYMPKAK